MADLSKVPILSLMISRSLLLLMSDCPISKLFKYALFSTAYKSYAAPENVNIMRAAFSFIKNVVAVANHIYLGRRFLLPVFNLF